MTLEIPDMLMHRGQRRELWGDPLWPRLRRIPKAWRPRFVSPGSHCYRGYVAT